MDEIVVLKAPAPLDLEGISRRARPALQRAGVDRAFVIGSYARGTADAWSDLDLVIVLDTTLPFVERGRLLGQLFEAIPVGIDLLVYTPQEFEEGLRRGLGIFAALRSEGVKIHDRVEQ